LAAAVLMVLTFNQIKIWKSNMTLADRIIETNPETDYIGRAYGIRANYKKDITKDANGALADYQKALELDSTDWIASYQSGLIYKSLGDNSKAIDYFNKANQSDIENPMPLCDIGVIHLEIKNYYLALKFADSAINVSPNWAKALNLKAACLLNLGNAIDAEKYFSKAIDANPNYTEAIKNRGIVRLNNLNNKDGACSDFKKAAELGEPGMDQILKDYCN
jgi:tetratricopeptide (TPR) repeat protein